MKHQFSTSDSPLNDEQVVSGRACSPQMLGSLVRGLALLLLIEVASGFVTGNHGALLSRRAYTSRVSTGACASSITLARNCEPSFDVVLINTCHAVKILAGSFDKASGEGVRIQACRQQEVGRRADHLEGYACAVPRPAAQ